MTIEMMDVPSGPAVVGPYSPVVRAGDFLICAGQIGIDPAKGALVEGIESQTEQVMKNIAVVLGDAGASINDIAHCRIYLTDMADYAKVNEIYAAALGDHRPARAAVQVSGLPAGALIEIEAWAYSPK